MSSNEPELWFHLLQNKKINQKKLEEKQEVLDSLPFGQRMCLSLDPRRNFSWLLFARFGHSK